jgi:hypothetical protein
MKRKNNLISSLSFSILLSSLLISGCSSSSTDTQNSSEADETTEETNETVQNAILDPEAYYYIEYAEKEDDTLSLNILLGLRHGRFTDDFDVDKLEFGDDLATATAVKIDSIDQENNTAELYVTVQNSDLDIDDLSLQSTLCLKAGAIQNNNNEVCDTLVFNQELTFSDEDRESKDNLTQYWFKKTHTYVARIKNEGFNWSTTVPDACGIKSEQGVLTYVIFDLTQVTSPYDTYVQSDAIQIILERKGYAPTAVVINADNYIYKDIQEYLEYYPEAKFQFVSGDVSGVNFNDKNIYSTIQKLIKSGKLKEY